MKSVLNNRILWYDGTNEVQASLVPELLIAGVPTNKIISSGPDVEQFNRLSLDEVINSTKTNCCDVSFDWRIPVEYKNLDIRVYSSDKLRQFLINNDRRKTDYEFRLNAELDEIEHRGLTMMFRTIIFVVDTFSKNNQIWGVGRGSSCASLVLYLIGLHSVDPVKYGIGMAEFFHD